MKDIIIEPLTKETMEGEAYVHCQSWKESYRGMVNDNYLDSLTVEHCLKRIQENHDPTFVALDGKNVIGFTSCCASRDDDLPDAGEIKAIYVLNAYKRRKIGTKLMEQCISNLAGYDTIFLWVVTENLSAIHFYEKMGFHPDGKSQTISLDGPVNLIRLVHINKTV